VLRWTQIDAPGQLAALQPGPCSDREGAPSRSQEIVEYGTGDLHVGHHNDLFAAGALGLD
jgi:hypothetical protein